MDLAAKKAEIRLLLLEPEVDLWKLRELCLTEGGLCDGMYHQSSCQHVLSLFVFPH